MTDFRQRIYDNDLEARETPLVADSLDDLHFPPDREAPIFELGCGHRALADAIRSALRFFILIETGMDVGIFSQNLTAVAIK